MNQQESRELQLITDTVCSIVDAEKIYLFGSYAYGVPKEDSDFDGIIDECARLMPYGVQVR